MKSVQVHLTKAPDKAATGIVGFDSITGGGLPRGRTTLLVGGSGFDEDEALYKFRLYVAGDALNSAQALANLTALCRDYLAGRYEIEVIDVFEQPERALADAIYLTPTLVKLAPLPTQTIVGPLSQTHTLLQALGLADGTP